MGKSVGAQVHRKMPMPVANLIMVGSHNHCILMLEDAGGEILLSSHCFVRITCMHKMDTAWQGADIELDCL